MTFQDLKIAFTTASILIHIDFLKIFYLEIDASNFALRAILSQIEKDRKFYLIMFYFRKFSTIKINYKIYNKELLVIIDSL